MRTPDARPRLIALLGEPPGTLRWLALLGLRKLGGDPASFLAIQRAYATALPEEQGVFLRTASACATTESDVAWILERAELDHVESGLLVRLRWVAHLPIAPIWLDRALDDVRDLPFGETRHACKATFSIAGIPIAETHFQITIGPRTTERREVATRTRTFQSAFASYAHKDRKRVLARIQGMQKAAPFVDIFFDVKSLRSGDHWEDLIRNEIKARDVLLLFWSRAAQKSRWVKTEWRIALADKGVDGINPVPLERPSKALKPPRELKALHFDEWTLAIR